jgi:hypothetical protein
MDEPTIKCDVVVHVAINFPPSDTGHLGEILAATRENGITMATLQDTVNQLAGDDTELAADVNALVNIINDIPARIQAAVVSALTSAGFNDTTIQAALDGVDSTVKTAIAAAKAALPVLPGTGTDTTGGTTQSGTTAVDTITGGTGDDSLTGANSTVGGQGSDTLGAGVGNDSLTGANSAASSAPVLTGDGPSVPPPSAGGAVPPASNAT